MIKSRKIGKIIARLVVIVAGVLLLGWQTAEAHPWYPDDGCRPGLSSDGYFYAAGPAGNWVVDTSSGWNGCHLRTLNTFNSIVNFGEWFLPVPGPSDFTYSHVYNLYAYVQSNRTNLTSNANYRGWANGHSGGVTASFYLSQQLNRNGFCYSLGSTWLDGRNGGFADLVDATGESGSTTWLVFDIFCFLA